MSDLKQTLLLKLDALILQTQLEVSAEQKEQLVGYVLMLNKWNKAYNLTSVRNPMDMLIRHIMDSIVVSPHLSGERFIDVGTGPGLPGIPLAIMNPEFDFFLLDSLGKRVRFIKQVLHELKIENVSPIQSRVEEFEPEVKFDGVISRAFASIDDMISWCHHLPKPNAGLFYALKGLHVSDEIEKLPQSIELIDTIALKVPELDGERYLVTLKAKL